MMSRSKKLFLGLLAAWTPIYMVIFLVWWALMFWSFDQGGPQPPNEQFFASFAVIAVLHAGTMLSAFGQMFCYLYHALTKNDAIDPNMKVVWVIALFFVSMIAIPLYWLLYIWREPEASVAKVKGAFD
jgi:hypothetical protein